MLKLFKKRTETVDDMIKNRDCNNVLEQVRDLYARDMTSIIIVVEKKKQSYWYSAGMEPAQAILALDQLHHRVQHEGLKDYD